jgi:aspartate oxidase
MKVIKVQPTDVLVVGGGLGAMYTAIEAAKSGGHVTLISKAPVGGSGSSLVSMSVHRFAPTEASEKSNYLERFLDSCKGIGNPALIDLLVEQGAQAVERLCDLGPKLEFKDVSVGGCDYHFFACGIPKQGSSLTKPVLRYLKSLPNVRLEEGYMAVRLVMDNRRINGILAERGNELYFFPAKAVVLATGGAGPVYENTSNTSDLTGDGYAMALEAGLSLQDMEFVQFYPYRVYSPARCDIFPDLFERGARYFNERGERFMEAYPKKELENRDVLARAMFGQKEIVFDLDECDQEFLSSECPNIYELYRRHTDSKLLVKPVSHFMMGGVPLRADCSTDIEGLYCCGEITGGLHGANRISGSALTELAVFGPIAGREAASYAQNRPNDASLTGPDEAKMPPLGKDTQETIVAALRQTMWENASLIRTAESLSRANKMLTRLQRELLSQRPKSLRRFLECSNLLNVARVIVAAAALRQESRGAHYRADCPDLKPEWTGHILFNNQMICFKR